MAKINFTQENEARLKVLFVELGFTGEVLSGKFGANAYTVWDMLHNLTVSTLKQLNTSLKKEVVALEEQDDWTVSQYQLAKAAKTRKWQEFVNLVVGYKLFNQEKAEEAIKVRAEKERKLSVLKQLKDEAEIKALGALSAEELQKQIDELEK